MVSYNSLIMRHLYMFKVYRHGGLTLTLWDLSNSLCLIVGLEHCLGFLGEALCLHSAFLRSELVLANWPGAAWQKCWRLGREGIGV